MPSDDIAADSPSHESEELHQVIDSDDEIVSLCDLDKLTKSEPLDVDQFDDCSTDIDQDAHLELPVFLHNDVVLPFQSWATSAPSAVKTEKPFSSDIFFNKPLIAPSIANGNNINSLTNSKSPFSPRTLSDSTSTTLPLLPGSLSSSSVNPNSTLRHLFSNSASDSAGSLCATSANSASNVLPGKIDNYSKH